jgi:ketosteroid isomerase-like protein
MVDAETAAWNARDAEALVSLFHPDMVWPWPPTAEAHDPMTWVMPYGRFDRERWKRSWEELFDTHDLAHNNRRTVRIAVSEQGDGAFAVVDVDTLWINRSVGQPFHWKGRACKVYTKVGGRWLFIFQTGVLDYDHWKVIRSESAPMGAGDLS